MRKRIFEIVEPAKTKDRNSAVYDVFMMVIILISLVPLAFKTEIVFFDIVDKICAAIFIFDYLLRWITADYKFNKKSVFSFLRYPFSFMAIIDLLSVLPSLTALNSGFKILRIFRMFRALRVFRAAKAFRYSKSLRIIINVFRKSREPLAAVGTFAIAYILISALVILNVEPDSFNNYFDAVYWATVSLTTVGYGDLYPVTIVGRIVAMLSSLFGIAIVALPSGIITAGYLNEIEHPEQLTDETQGKN